MTLPLFGPWTENSHLRGGLAIVGEAPGEQEIRVGKPFVGPSGVELDTWLNRIGFSRANAFVTNLFHFHPAKNDIKPYLAWKKTGMTESDVYRLAQGRLREELEIIQPNCVLALGVSAMYALTGIFEMGNYRGSNLPSNLIPGLKVVPTYHPSSVLRYSDADKRHCVMYDVQKAVRLSQDPKPWHDPRTYHIFPKFEHAYEYLKTAATCPEIGSDIETIYVKDTPLVELTHWSVAISETETMSIPFQRSTNHYFDPSQEALLLGVLANISSDPKVIKVGQNYIFDSSFLLNRYGFPSIGIRDTMIAECLLVPEMPKKLGFLTTKYTDLAYYKDDGKKHGVSFGREELFNLYSAKDAVVTLEIYHKQLDRIKKKGLEWFFLHKCELIEVCQFLNRHGILVDIEAKSTVKAALLDELSSLDKQITLLVGHKINLNSSVQLKKYFYEEARLKPYLKDGKPTTDESALIKLAGRQSSEVAQLMLRQRELYKIVSTYLSASLGADSRFHSLFDPVGARSRMSSKRDTDGGGGNLQNQIQVMKRTLLADEKHLLFNVDLSQAENRIVAYNWDVEPMIEAFETDQDVHKLTAVMVLAEGFGKLKTMSEVTKEERQEFGKRPNHSFNYGLSPQGFSDKYQLALDLSKRIHTAYHRAYPQIHEYHEVIRRQIQHFRRLDDLFGFPWYYTGMLTEETFRHGFNYVPQSTVGWIINEWGILAMYRDQSHFGHVAVTNQVHDSISFQMPLAIPLAAQADTIIRLKDSLERNLTTSDKFRTFVIPIDCECGSSYASYDPDHPELAPNGLKKVSLKSRDSIIHSLESHCIDLGLEYKL